MLQPLDCGGDIIGFAFPIVMLALAQSRPAKVETQHRKSESVERLHGVECDLVVHGAAKNRVRVADQGGVCSLLRAGIQQAFQSAGRALQKK